MAYILVSDDCHDCNYVCNAFTLLNLPYETLSIDQITADKLADTTVTIACKRIEKDHRAFLTQIAQESGKSILSWTHEEIIRQHNQAIRFLKMPFSIYQFKEALAFEHETKAHLDFTHPAYEKLVGHSQKINDVKLLIQQVAFTDSTVLILGQSGTGKDVIASAIHHLSDRKNKPFVPINCGAIPSELMESELFGHEKGAFTGALTRKPGRFEMANGGTLFLDEIGDMPLPMQVKLLRVVQERKVEHVGGQHSIDVDVRLVAATHKNLNEMIEKNLFREDLYYRLNVFPIHVPSLHERQEDIPMIIDYQLNKMQARLKHQVSFTDSAMQQLCSYNWPGNIRELQNFLERIVILHPDCVVDEKELGLPINAKKPTKKTTKQSKTPVEA